MAERDEPVLHGELREMIQRLDERISALDRNITDAIKNLRGDFHEMRSDIRQMRNWMIMLYLFIMAVASSAVAVYSALSKP